MEGRGAAEKGRGSTEGRSTPVHSGMTVSSQVIDNYLILIFCGKNSENLLSNFQDYVINQGQHVQIHLLKVFL